MGDELATAFDQAFQRFQRVELVREGQAVGPTVHVRGGIIPTFNAVAGEAWLPRARRCGLYAQVAGRIRADATTTDIPAGSLAWFSEAPSALRFLPDDAIAKPVPGWWLAADAEEAAA